ncbi:unnamed protein product [Microthlaspi erraticum]|uniref:Uncharacterized protein n=1 Tax=Microthlaspi erraticum TaxID=1685480 RepID=A0A6D2KEQ8_9BRAS|nr:unnamed protein product [Microthlaspi erraticum]CAA7050309.1 unnamed protein product [Microthlaspi erraticum]CAA7060789.1 unnamed protein product [Microthlaspi erraticum]
MDLPFHAPISRCHPNCLRALNAQEDYDASQRAAMLAVDLISSARVVFKVDREYTEYSAQYLVDNAGPKKESGQGEWEQGRGITMNDLVEYLRDIAIPNQEGELDQERPVLTVKDCLECAFRDGLPRKGHWGHVGCVSKVPPFASLIPRVPMKGKVLEAETWEGGVALLEKQPVGAKLHVFSPEIDLVDEGEGVYDGPAGPGSTYVGLRDVMITGYGKKVAELRICYKKKSKFIKVSLERVLTSLPKDGEEPQVIEPTGLLVDFIVPRFKKRRA